MLIDIEGIPVRILGLVGSFRMRRGEDRQPVFLGESPQDSCEVCLVCLEALGIHPDSPILAMALAVAPLVTPPRGMLTRFLCYYYYGSPKG